MKRLLSILAAAIFGLGLWYIYWELPLVRIGALSPLDFFLIIVAVIAIPGVILNFARRSGRSALNAQQINKGADNA